MPWALNPETEFLLMKTSEKRDLNDRFLESPDCLICHSRQNTSFLTVPNRFYLSEKFNLSRCLNCNFVFLNPRPVEKSIGRYYQDENYQPHQPQSRTLSDKIYHWIRVWNNRYKRRKIERLIPGGIIFDYGCGTGEFLVEMRTTGWKTIGFEPSGAAAEIAGKYGLSLVPDLGHLPGNITIITLWHVLEHVHQAEALLEKVKQQLAPNGYLIIALPNRQCFDARSFRESWVAFDAPRHLYHFTPDDLRSLLSNKGFQIIFTARLWFDPWYNSLLSAQLKAQMNGKIAGLQIFFNALWIGLISSIASLINKNKSSSMIYFIRHENSPTRV